jgi:deoxyribonuclease V
MKLEKPLIWPQRVEEATAIQEELRGQVIVEDDLPRVRYVAGVDGGYQEQEQQTQAAVAVLSFPDLQLCDQAIARCPTQFPYIPGFLWFREVPPDERSPRVELGYLPGAISIALPPDLGHS